jgi:hypothetical protein
MTALYKETLHHMKKAMVIAGIVGFLTLVPAIFSSNSSVLADPAGCCMERPNVNSAWAPNQLNFAACQQLNQALDNDDIFQQSGRVWWNLQCQ